MMMSKTSPTSEKSDSWKKRRYKDYELFPCNELADECPDCKNKPQKRADNIMKDRIINPKNNFHS